MTQEEIVKYTDHLLAEFYKDCQKQYNKDNRQVDIVLSNGDFSTLQNIMCEAIANNQNQIINKACKVFQEMLVELCPELLGYGAIAKGWENDFRKQLEE